MRLLILRLPLITGRKEKQTNELLALPINSICSKGIDFRELLYVCMSRYVVHGVFTLLDLIRMEIFRELFRVAKFHSCTCTVC